ncbi:hypothetical protein EVAR_102918_1 [Eumeta japonica]|uniref:Uncharacterized protein n=1 Tax=Eumeta variegata TaxID=151549 RepID=A0A4C1ZQR0_EUMVA|nr:hypothetical protein EVAR_102918_1 [Eumeta japonica]
MSDSVSEFSASAKEMARFRPASSLAHTRRALAFSKLGSKPWEETVFPGRQHNCFRETAENYEGLRRGLRRRKSVFRTVKFNAADRTAPPCRSQSAETARSVPSATRRAVAAYYFSTPPRTGRPPNYWNAVDISGKMQDLRTLVQSQDIHIVLLGETKLRPRQQLRLPNFFVYRRDEVSPRGIAFRGTAVLVRRDIVHGGLE